MDPTDDLMQDFRVCLGLLHTGPLYNLLQSCMARTIRMQESLQTAGIVAFNNDTEISRLKEENKRLRAKLGKILDEDDDDPYNGQR